MNKKIVRQRYFVAWIFIVAVVVGGYIAILYNTNTILMAFGKGKVRLNSFSAVLNYVQDFYEDYNIIHKSKNLRGEDYIEFSTVDNFAIIQVTGKDDSITRISGEFDIAAINPLQVTQINSTIDRVLEPVVEKGYILPLKIAILKESLLRIQISDHYKLDIVIDDKEFVLEKEKNSTVFSFIIIPRGN